VAWLGLEFVALVVAPMDMWGDLPTIARSKGGYVR